MIKYILTLLVILFSNFTFASVISGNGKIVHIADGDTFDVQVYNKQDLKNLIRANYVGLQHVDTKNGVFRIRLANVNTEESTHLDSSRNTDFGETTSNAVKSTFSNAEGNFRCYKKGKYERAICSFTTDRNIDIGIWLIQNDYSPYVKKYGRHPEFHSQYVSASNHNNSFELGNIFAGKRTNHRDNEHHSGNRNVSKNVDRNKNYREKLENKYSQNFNPILEKASKTTVRNQLNGFINRNKEHLKQSGNLDAFMNR
jgi:endonuclease YncB( thermonuclease family)